MASSSDVIRQAAAIPVRGGQVCLITSRSGKRWVVPKGCLEPGMTSGEIALKEAWEEAGLSGVLQPEPVGSYVYEKSGFSCHVTVYFLQVTTAADDWPEREFRDRCWLAPGGAIARVEEAGLRELIRSVVSTMNGGLAKLDC